MVGNRLALAPVCGALTMNGTDPNKQLKAGERPLDLSTGILSSNEQPLDLNTGTVGADGSSPGAVGGFLTGAGGQGGLLPNLSPVPTSWYGQAWNAITNPSTAGVDLAKRIGTGIASEAFAPVVGAYKTARAVGRGDLAEAAKQYVRSIPGVAAVSDLAQGMWSNQQGQAARAAAAADRGDYNLAAAQNVLTDVPMLGPQIGAGLEQIRRGQLAGDSGQMGAGVGQLAAIPAGFALPEALEAGTGLLSRAVKPGAGSLASRMAEQIGPPGVPALDMTRTDVVDAANRMGVNLPLGKATGSETLKGAEAVAESSLFGGPRMEAVAKSNQAALNGEWDRMVTQADPNNIGATPELTGRNLNQQGDSIYNVEKLAKDTAYGQLAPAEPDIGDVRLNDLEDWARTKLFHPKTGKPIGMPDDLRQAYLQALDIRNVGKQSSAKLMGPALPEAAPGGGGVRPDLSGALPAGSAVDGVDGNGFNLKTAGGDMPGQYRVVEANDLNTSHDARNFSINPDYPAGVQERAYHSNGDLQAGVRDHVQNYDPAFTINNNPDAVNGPPVTLADGTVLGGNGRTMSTQLLYDSTGPNREVYRNALLDQAAQFGVDPADIAKMDRPVLVRQLAERPETVDDARRIASDLNQPFTAVLSPEEKAVSRGRSITPGTLNSIGGMFEGMADNATLNDLLDSKTKAPDVWGLLARDGVVTQGEAATYWDGPEGKFTPEGKQFVRNALVGSVVNDVDLLRRAPSSILGRVGRSLPDLSRLMARGDDWDITPVVQRALDEHTNLSKQQLTVDDYLRQRPMFGGPRNPLVDVLVARLGEPGPGFKNALSQFAGDSAADVPGQGMLAGAVKPTASRSFNDAFGTAISRKQYNQALADARTGVLNGVQSGRVGQVSEAVGSGDASGRSRYAAENTGAGGALPTGGGGPDISGAQVRGDEGLGAGEGAAGAGTPGGGSVTPEIAGRNVTDWFSAKHAKSEWFDKSKNFSGNIRDDVAGAYANMVKLLDPAQAEAARAHSPLTEQQWRYANGLNEQLYEDWNSLGSDLAPTRNTPEGWLANLQQHYLAQGKAGGASARIEALQNKGFDLSGLRQQALDQLAAKKFSVAGDKLGGFSDEFLHTLFDPVDPSFVDQLYEFGAVKRVLGEEFNPSRSGKLLTMRQQLMALPGAIVTGNLGTAASAAMGLVDPWAGARMVTSPGVFKYLTQPRGAIGAALSPETAAALRAGALLRQQQQNQDQGQ